MRNKDITVETVMLHNMSSDINTWLHEKGKDIDKYCNFIDRVAEIAIILRESLDKTADQLKEYAAKPHPTIKVIDLPEGINECQPNTNTKSSCQ